MHHITNKGSTEVTEQALYLLHIGLLLRQQLLCALVGVVNKIPDLRIDQAGRRLAVRLLQNHVSLPREVERHLTHLLVHPKLYYLWTEAQTLSCR